MKSFPSVNADPLSSIHIERLGMRIQSSLQGKVPVRQRAMISRNTNFFNFFTGTGRLSLLRFRLIMPRPGLWTFT